MKEATLKEIYNKLIVLESRVDEIGAGRSEDSLLFSRYAVYIIILLILDIITGIVLWMEVLA